MWKKLTSAKIKQQAITVLITVFFSNNVFAQDNDIIKMENEALNYFQNFEYHKALPIYLELDSIQPNNTSYMYPIGICYLNTTYKEDKALAYFEKCLRDSKKHPPALYYYAGKAYHLSHKMDAATEYLNLYIDQLKKNEKKNQKAIQDLNWDLEMIRNGKELMAHPLKVDIVNMGPKINSNYPDYGAVLSADQHVLLFTSCRPNTTGGLIDPADGRYHEDIYISFNSDSGWTEPKNLGDSVNTKGHDASVALSADGQTLFLFRINTDPLSFSSGDIYSSELKGNNWSKATPLSSNINSNAHEPGASLSPDGRTLFFSSNKSGGHGGMDLYMVKKLPNGDWAEPINLGNKINSKYDEDFPFIHSDGKTLYFSSNGHKTMGGFDIFYSTFNDETQEWSEPENVGYPISTAHDDIFFNWSPDGKRIYFSSIRPDSYGDQDIYYAVVHKHESTEVLVMKGFIVDSLNQKPILGQITISDKSTDEVIGVFSSNSETGKYLIILPEGHYKMKIEAADHDSCEQFLDVTEIKGFEEMDKDITLCPNMIFMK